MLRFLKMRWLFNRYMLLSLFGCIMVIIGAALINIIGIEIAGDLTIWANWLETQSQLFLIWRLILYVLIGKGWWWMRKRVIDREALISPENVIEASKRIKRIEIATITTMLALEISRFWTAI